MLERRLLPVIVLVSVLALPVDAQASGPIVMRVPVDDVFTTGYCGFPMEIRTTGTAVVHLFLDEAGAFDRVLITAPQTVLTFTNLLNGKSVWTPSVNMVQQSQNDDGSRTTSLRGLFWHLIVPGEGLMTADVGRLDIHMTIDDEGNLHEEVVFDAGQQEGAFLSLLCSTLG